MGGGQKSLLKSAARFAMISRCLSAAARPPCSLKSYSQDPANLRLVSRSRCAPLLPHASTSGGRGSGSTAFVPSSGRGELAEVCRAESAGDAAQQELRPPKNPALRQALRVAQRVHSTRRLAPDWLRFVAQWTPIVAAAWATIGRDESKPSAIPERVGSYNAATFEFCHKKQVVWTKLATIGRTGPFCCGIDGADFLPWQRQLGGGPTAAA